ncbi:bifunctional diguanylate cyclase/phosphodiesterase [Niveibacterium sp. SC-1]|uniref:putative bifunctional diguanylate cyclase/phosphodiesterase n=1 Tax=Niveibacterium sp. SC-1 TaxID=3135646 RepID=UPI00311D46CC
MFPEILRGATLKRLPARVFEFLLLKQDQPLVHQAQVRLSALRVILVSSAVLVALIALHSGVVAWRSGQTQVVWVSAVFYAFPLLALALSARFPRVASSVLLVSVYVAGCFIASFLQIPELQRLGLLLCYCAPLIAGLLLGYRLALSLVAINLLPFLFASSGWTSPGIPGLDFRLPMAPVYIHGLIFVFFNLCVPLAVFRVLHAAGTAMEGLAAANALYEDLFEHGGTAAVLCNGRGVILRANAVFARLFGREDDVRLRGGPLVALLHSRTDLSGRTPPGRAPQRVGELARGSEWLTVADDAGLQRCLQVRSASITAQGNHVLTFIDVSDLRRMQADLHDSEARAQFLAQHDAQTGLPNRTYLGAWVGDAMLRHPEGMLLPVLALRLNILRQVNARFGSAEGDRVIARFGRALRDCGAGTSFVARIRGVVFAAVLPPAASVEDALRQGQALLDALPREVEAGDEDVRLDVSAGLAFHPGDSDSPVELVRRAEVALDAARRRGRPIGVFDREAAELTGRRVAVEMALQRAVEQRELSVHYQPKFTAEGRLLGFEALMRWHSASLGEVAPSEFIPIAEEAGIISRLTDLVLDEVCRQVAEWQSEGIRPPRVGVNLSERDLDRADLVDVVVATVARHRIPPQSIELEVTETFLAAQTEHAIRQLRLLREHGFGIAIDDFGAGYSSLAKLVELPLSGLKIDRAFLRELPGNVRRERVVRTIVTLARGLELEVIAEGVEDPAQLAFLEALGCDGYQGFLFHAPAPAARWRGILNEAAAGLRPGGTSRRLSAVH